MTFTEAEIEVFRSALYPRFMTEDSLFAPEQLVSDWGPIDTEEGTKALALSIGLGSLLATMDLVHDFGCRTAAAANELISQKAEANGQTAEPIFYRGSYALSVNDIMAMDFPEFTIHINHVEEEGRKEHGHIELHPKDPKMSGNQLKKRRISAIAQTYLILRSPHEHICEGVSDDMRAKLEGIRLLDVVGPDA